MSTSLTKPRLWLSTRQPKRGDVVTVKVMVMHAMETGMRKRASGEMIPRRIVDKLDCTFAGAAILSWRLDTAVSPNPYLEFRFRPHQSGDLTMIWSEEGGDRLEMVERIDVV